jgi:hypothetical protein
VLAATFELLCSTAVLAAPETAGASPIAPTPKPNDASVAITDRYLMWPPASVYEYDLDPLHRGTSLCNGKSYRQIALLARQMR